MEFDFRRLSFEICQHGFRIGRRDRARRVVRGSTSRLRPGVLDCRATLRQHLDGDLELFRDLLGFYFRDTPMLTEELGRIVQAGRCRRRATLGTPAQGIGQQFRRPARHPSGRLNWNRWAFRADLAGACPTVFRRLEAELRELSIQLRQF